MLLERRKSWIIVFFEKCVILFWGCNKNCLFLRFDKPVKKNMEWNTIFIAMKVAISKTMT